MKKRIKNKKIALILGITGQDGSYLAEHLLAKNYVVHGMVRRSSTFNRQNIEHIFNSVERRQAYLHYGDMTDINSLTKIISEVEPDEIYNLAAQSDVRASFDVPCYTAMVDSLGVLSMLEAVRMVNPKIKIYQASTSELYSGDPAQAPQNEMTPFKPRSPYGVAKLYGFEIARIYRESYGMFICNGILFNHESPRRGYTFLTRKVTVGIANILNGTTNKLTVGNLEAHRDWGYAKEYMEMAWAMLQEKTPDDYVVATGETHTVREFIEEAFTCVGIDIIWKGKGVREKGIDKKTKRVLVEINPDYFRPNEVDYLCGDARKAQKKLTWKPKTTFKELVHMMVNHDVDELHNGEE